MVTSCNFEEMTLFLQSGCKTNTLWTFLIISETHHVPPDFEFYVEWYLIREDKAREVWPRHVIYFSCYSETQSALEVERRRAKYKTCCLLDNSWVSTLKPETWLTEALYTYGLPLKHTNFCKFQVFSNAFSLITDAVKQVCIFIFYNFPLRVLSLETFQAASFRLLRYFDDRQVLIAELEAPIKLGVMTVFVGM